jgi:hypothetical protein
LNPAIAGSAAQGPAMHSHRAQPRDFEALGLVLGLFAILFVLCLTLGTPGVY